MIVLAIFCLVANCRVYSQRSTSTVDDLFNELEENLSTAINDPKNFNTVLDLLESQFINEKGENWKWLNHLNTEFKTFQNQDSTSSSLGFAYGLNIERAQIKTKKEITNGKSLSFDTNGNIAFNKELNPYDFLDSKLSLNFFHSGGGVEISDPQYDQTYYSNLRRRFATYSKVEDILNSEEWLRLKETYKIKNSWIFKYGLNTGVESNQDFSNTQYTLGIDVGTGIKSWNPESLVSKLNFLDYPFERIRKITNYSGNIHPGVTVPSLRIGFDYVNPLDDPVREKIEHELQSFPRLNLELGFRTVITEVSNQVLFFNSSLQYFQEVNASDAIIAHNLDDFLYFTSSISTSTGLFVSYSSGNLPFDRKSDAVYEFGFRYKMN